MAWEVDFWGHFRRAITAAEDTLDADCTAYNGAMVTLLGDVARYYVQFRTDQTRIELVRANVASSARVGDCQETLPGGPDERPGLEPGPQHACPKPRLKYLLLLSDLRMAEVRFVC